MHIYKLPGNKQQLLFTHNVLKHFSKYRQKNAWQSEAGGQLFARITPQIVIIASATGPHKRDFRSRFSFFPNKKRFKMEIEEHFIKGLHYVGDWHTHPQKRPSPSKLDLHSMRNCFIQSDHELEYFVLVVVGKEPFKERNWVGVINHKRVLNLRTLNAPINRKTFRIKID